jgi:hypothetical protein
MQNKRNDLSERELQQRNNFAICILQSSFCICRKAILPLEKSLSRELKASYDLLGMENYY